MQKRTKAILCAACSAVMLFSTGYAAEYGAAFDQESGRITISSSLEETGFGTFLYIFQGKIEKTEKISDKLSKDTLLYAGGLTQAFALPSDAPDGVYTVVFCAKTIPSDGDRLVYVLKADLQTQQAGLKAVLQAASAQEMLSALQENNEKAFILELDGAEEKAQLLYDVVKEMGLDTKVDPVFSDLEEAYALADVLSSMQSVSEEELAEIFLANKQILGLNDDIEKYARETAEALVAAREDGLVLDSLAGAKQAAREQLALTVLNHAGNSEIFPTIEKYNDIFQVTYSAHKGSVSEYDVAKLIAGTVFTDVAEVEKVVNNAIEQVYQKQQSGSTSVVRPSGGSSGGGGFGGGSSGSGMGYDAPSLIEKEEVIGDLGQNTGFSDISGYDWAKDAIAYLAANNIMVGDSSGLFRPGDSVTREELVKVIVMAIGKGKLETADLDFEDVQDEWYKTYIETAYKNGIIKGLTETRFGVGEAVTREDACVMLVRAAEAYYKTFHKEQTLVDIQDFDTVSDYARVSVDTLARAQIISGFEDGTFRPQQNITRAEIAKVIYGCLKNIEA
ncbi:S-layer homology domain-containing protein [Ructibacterium gallinarum]|uniref:S-layer homology domain-containing protein n=1 Tax=Ructibacterium gallinarum TaxID=2779355 RepID=A0A9D5M216_9FIRM|nr:S-layer homology domain-containing protein [Ructibacterium gallinarum]MBE5039155.1 S-layer homology domain-containing protein [Ructibacterium gallinarum]